MVLLRQLVAPALIVRRVAERLKQHLPLHVQLEIGELDERSIARIDAKALEQLLAGLCSISRDAMPEGGTIRIDCRTTFLDSTYLSTDPWIIPGFYVCVSISDTGSGPAAATHHRVSELLWGKSARPGAARAESMLRGLFDRHRGMVHISPPSNRGMIVRLYLSVVQRI